MSVQSTHEPVPAGSLRDKLLKRRKYSTAMLYNVVHRFREPIRPRMSTAEQRSFILTGFILSLAALPMIFFPLCGLPVAVVSLFMGLYGRYRTPLFRLSTWTIIVSVVVLLLSFLCMLLWLSIYFSTYFAS